MPGREHLSHAKPRRAATAAGTPEEGWMDRHQDRGNQAGHSATRQLRFPHLHFWGRLSIS